MSNGLQCQALELHENDSEEQVDRNSYILVCAVCNETEVCPLFSKGFVPRC